MLFPEADTALPFLIEWGEEKNVPTDKKLVNPQHIHKIQSNITKEAYQRIYKLTFDNETVELGNTLLYTGESEIIDFQLKNDHSK